MKKMYLFGTICLLIIISVIFFIKSFIWIPKFYISGDSWDFGAVKNIKSVKHRFIIKNLGKADLTLTAWPSCPKCIHPILTLSKVPPQGKTELIVELLIKKAGRNEAYIMLETNDPKQPAKKISLKSIAVN